MALLGGLYAQVDTLDVAVDVMPQPDPDLSLVDRDDLLNLIQLGDYNSFPEDYSKDFSKCIQLNPSTFYEHQNQALGLNHEIPHLKYHGFELPARAMNRALYLANFKMYHELAVSNKQYQIWQRVYPYPIAVSRLTGSLGDYDSRYVSAMLSKSRIFGFQNSAVKFDFTAQNGYWADTPGSLSAMKLYAELGLYGVDLAFDYASYKRETSMYELLPMYWRNVNFPVSHELKNLFLSASWGSLELSYLNSSDEASSVYFNQVLNAQSQQFALENTFEWGKGDAALRYEYADVNSNYATTNSYNLEKYKHLLSFAAHANSPLIFDTQVELFDWKRLRTGADLGYARGYYQGGVYAQVYGGAREEITSIPDIYTTGADLSVPFIYSPAEWGVYLLYARDQLSAKLTLGQRQSELHLPAGTAEKNLAVAHLAAKWNPRWGDWELLIQPVWNYQQFSQELMESPEFSFRSEQVLTRHLGHDNALSAGMSLYGHSEYYAANVAMPYLIGGSTLIDVWAGVKITRQFDFAVSFKNLFSAALYAVNPIPMSVHASLKWYFLN
jgi:hypothetical protein